MRRRKNNVKPRRTLLVVTASEAESLYFSQMRKDCRYTNMTVLWDQEAETVEDLIKTAYKLRTKEKFDSVWCVFGFSALGVKTEQVKEFSEIAKKKRVQLAWINPDISLWYLLHLQSPRMPIGNTSVIESTLRGVFPGYSAQAEYLLNAGSALHLKLFPAKAQAVVNAGSYNTLAQQTHGGVPPVNMTKLLTEISDICGSADMTHNQKLIGLKNA